MDYHRRRGRQASFICSQLKQLALGGRRSAVILLAEDNEANIGLLTDYLEGEGYHVVVARNGVEAVDRAREERPALILMDIQMPELNGLEAIRQIRAEPQLIDTPIIALTALAMPEDRERCLAAGANDYLSKPVSLKKLIVTIEPPK
jgi:CheY-like chemotaxis protein